VGKKDHGKPFRSNKGKKTFGLRNFRRWGSLPARKGVLTGEDKGGSIISEKRIDKNQSMGLREGERGGHLHVWKNMW